MSADLGAPDLETAVPLDPYAPGFARFCVGQVDSPSPDLRDATALLTSELVTRAVELYPKGERLPLQIWMPRDLVRVEITVGRDFFLPPPGASTGHYGVTLLNELADRWSVDPARDRASVWFEIDRHPVGSRTAGAGVLEHAS
jgi:hypothetical protein